MNHSIKNIIGFYFFLLPSTVIAQNSAQHNKAIDTYVQKLGSFDTLNMGTIAAIVTKPFQERKDKARAIFDWIAFNISYDTKAGRSGITEKNSATDVLLYRKAVGLGYASLFQDMCSSVNIRCLIPDGFAKLNPDQINETSPEINHSWAVVQLGQSPEEWFYVDPTWGSGYTDADCKVFTRSFNDVYFFADKSIFNLQHYPDNEGWKLGPAPKTRKDFFALPIYKAAAYEFKLTSANPANGHLKVKAGQLQNLVFKMDSAAVISKITLLRTDGKKQKEEPAKYSFVNGTLKITCKFEEGNSNQFTVKVNGKELISYLIEVE